MQRIILRKSERFEDEGNQRSDRKFGNLVKFPRGREIIMARYPRA